MKKLSLIALVITVSLLGGCATEEKKSEVPVEDIGIDIDSDSELESESEPLKEETISETTKQIELINHSFKMSEFYPNYTGELIIGLPEEVTRHNKTFISGDGPLDSSNYFGDFDGIVKLKDNETAFDNYIINRNIQEFSKQVTLFESDEIIEGAYLQTDKFMRIVLDYNPSKIGNEAIYFIDLGESFIGVLIFFLGEGDLIQEKIEMYDAISNSMYVTLGQNDETTSNNIKDDTSINTYAVDENSLHYQDGDKSKFESKFDQSLGDEVEIIEDQSVYAKVVLGDYRIINSVDGNGRKALALFYTVTNTSDNVIESTTFPFASTPTFMTEVYFGDKQLKPLVTTTPLLKMDGEDYINNKHVQFTPEDAKMDSCTKPEFLKPGELRDCYAHYSYAGPGEYIIGIIQMNDSGYHELQSYKLDISIEDEFTKNN